MTHSRTILVVVALAIMSRLLPAQRATSADSIAVESFNRALADATRRMDNDATLALWDDDGVSLLPSTVPIAGKPAIADFLRRVTAGLPGAHMERFDLRCHDIHVSGVWASEWCTEHQFVRFAGGQPPFDGWGTLLFILHRANDGRWRIHTEMWNQALPDTAKS